MLVNSSTFSKHPYRAVLLVIPAAAFLTFLLLPLPTVNRLSVPQPPEALTVDTLAWLHLGGVPPSRVEPSPPPTIAVPEISVVTNPPRENANKKLYFKAEYFVEVPACEGDGWEYDVQAEGQPCRLWDSKKNTYVGERVYKGVRGKEKIRIGFCGDAGMETEGNQWDFTWPGNSAQTGEMSEWILSKDKRPMSEWRQVTGREEVEFSSRIVDTTVGKQAWQLMLRIGDVEIDADPQSQVQNIRELEGSGGLNMWRYEGTYGGCPDIVNDGAGAQVVFDIDMASR